MNAGVVATRYAKALLDAAEDQKSGAEVYASMKRLALSFERLSTLREVVDNRMIPVDDRCRMLTEGASLPGQTAPPLLDSFFRLVIQHHRASLFRAITLQAVDLYRRRHHIVYGILTVTTPVNDSVYEKVSQLLSREGEHVELEVRCDPELLGGFVLETEMTILDASASTQLKRLRSALLAAQ